MDDKHNQINLLVHFGLKGEKLQPQTPENRS